MFVRVTQEDIDQGIVNAANFCPLALALKRKTDSVDIHVYWSSYYVNGQSHRMSSSGRRFVNHFDTGEKVKPGLYWL